jgi:hypothetical protein
MSRRAQVTVLAGCILLMSATTFAAEVQLRPFLGVTFGGSTTLNLANSADKANLALGISADLLGEIFGAEVDIGDAPGFFKSGPSELLLSSRVTTVTGNFVVAMPRRWTQYSLRPYLVAGGGLMRVHKEDVLDVFNVSSVLPAVDFGIGAVGFLSDRVGIGWDFRRFQSVGRNTVDVALTTTGNGEQRLSFWRAHMFVAIRIGGSTRE